MPIICMHFDIKGKVQGVWYRSATRDKANELDLTGWVKNLENGNVEVIACGNTTQLNTFEKWLQDGPPLAHVDRIVKEEILVEKCDSFKIF